MKYGYRKPKQNAQSSDGETLRECSRLSQRYFNLEDGIRRDRSRIDRLNAQIRGIERQIADIRAENNNPEIVTPGFSLARDKKPRFSFNPWTWAAQQSSEIIGATTAQADARDRIERLQAEKRDRQYDRDQSVRLMADSEAGKAEILQDMRDLGCPAAGSTNS
ncbi:MAG: hypothetical protein RIA71_01350 [Oceanicaulis sp.]